MWNPFKKKVFWEDRFNKLAEYNSEVYRGIVHTEEYNEKMKILQQDYNNKYNQFLEINNMWSKNGNLY